MDATVLIAGNFHMSPFEMFKQDTEEVIMVLNYLSEKGTEKAEKKPETSPKKEQRIRVNDKTATGGWY